MCTVYGFHRGGHVNVTLTCIGGHIATNLAAAFSPKVKGHCVAMLPHMVIQLF